MPQEASRVLSLVKSPSVGPRIALNRASVSRRSVQNAPLKPLDRSSLSGWCTSCVRATIMAASYQLSGRGTALTWFSALSWISTSTDSNTANSGLLKQFPKVALPAKCRNSVSPWPASHLGKCQAIAAQIPVKLSSLKRSLHRRNQAFALLDLSGGINSRTPPCSLKHLLLVLSEFAELVIRIQIVHRKVTSIWQGFGLRNFCLR